MPIITDQSLGVALSTDRTTVTIVVRYRAGFTELDRFLDQNGLRFTEKIRVVGRDRGTATETLARFPNEIIRTSGGTTPLTVQRERRLTVPRMWLQEDTAVLNDGDLDDEINCVISIEPRYLPTTVVAETPEVALAD